MKYTIILLSLLTLSIFAQETQYKCGLKKKDFQTVIDGKQTDLYIITNENGYEIAISNYGGAILAIMAPDIYNNVQNIVQGYDSIESLRKAPQKYLSTLIGRFSNRIKDGKFKINGIEYNLNLNDGGKNHLHGGKEGFDVRVWDAEQINNHTVRLTYVSPDLEEGYPGTLKMVVTFSIDNKNDFRISYRGKTDKTTIVNMSHHVFFNLHGITDPCPSIEDEILSINAYLYLPTDEDLVPNGTVDNVIGTPFDFLKPAIIGKRINEYSNNNIRYAKGYDHCYLIDQKSPYQMTWAAKIEDPINQRFVELYTTEPAVQLYTANLHTNFTGYKGVRFTKRTGIALEAQSYPNGPNFDHFPHSILNPGETYFQETVYRLGVYKKINK